MPRNLWTKKIFAWYKEKNNKKISPIIKTRKKINRVVPIMKIKRSKKKDYIYTHNRKNIVELIKKHNANNLSIYVN
jgi:hypothetical protein